MVIKSTGSPHNEVGFERIWLAKLKEKRALSELLNNGGRPASTNAPKTL